MKKPDDRPKAATPAPGKAERPVRAAGPVTREDRLKAALKANLARRKEQAKAKARTAPGQDADNTDK